MDATGQLEIIAKTLPLLPLESVESMLVAFDALIGVSGDGCRMDAAGFLIDAAASSADPEVKARLLRAAESVQAGEACGHTPEGLTWKEAAAAQTVNMDNWHEPPEPPEPISLDDDDAAEEEAEALMADAPAALPHLPVRHFFPGLMVRVARELRDTRGNMVPVGSVLSLLRADAAESEYVLSFLDRTIRVVPPAIENAGNSWFQPVPSVECLQDLWELVDDRLNEVDDLDDPDNVDLEDIVFDIAACEEWLSQDGERGPAPVCASGSKAAKVFGRGSEMAAWVPFLFAGVAVYREPVKGNAG